MRTGPQIRDGRAPPVRSHGETCRRALLKHGLIEQVEERDGAAQLTQGLGIAILRARGHAGVELVTSRRLLGGSGLKGAVSMIPTGWQLREARRLAGLSQAGLTRAAGVGLAVVVHAELVEHVPTLTVTHAGAIRTAFERAGIEFVREDSGIGVQRR